MKILMVGWGAEPDISGGMDVHTSSVFECLLRAGHEATLFVPLFDKAPSQNAGIKKIDAGEKPKNIAEVISFVKKYNTKIFSYAKMHEFDVIHTHDWLGAETGFLIQKKLGKKWVHTVHSLEYMRSCKEGTGKSKIEMLEELAIRASDELITVSIFMQKEIREKYGRDSKVIYNAPSIIKKNISDTARENKRILFVGRIAEQKGLKYLIYSAKDVLKKIPDAKFRIIGEGNLREPLEEFSNSLGVQNAIEFSGFVGREQLVQEYLKATLFISPSVYEPFGITLLDAAALGAPIIATRNTGALELFSTESVEVVHGESSKEISKNIIALLSDKKSREKMANAASEDVKKIKSWSEISKEISDVYSS